MMKMVLSWCHRHKILTGLAVLLLIGAIGNATDGSKSTTSATTDAPTVTPSPTSIAAAPPTPTVDPGAAAAAAKARAGQDAAAKARAGQDAAAKAAADQAAAAKASSDPASACFMRPAEYGDLILRLSDLGVPPTAQVLGGGWAYNHDTDTCQNGPDFLLAPAFQ